MKTILLERQIEGPCDGFAKKMGCVSRKMNGEGYRGWPDRMYIYHGRILFVEYKKPGGKPTPVQQAVHAMLIGHGMPVEVIDDKAKGRALITTFVEGGGAWAKTTSRIATRRRPSSSVSSTAASGSSKIRALARRARRSPSSRSSKSNIW